MQPSQHYAQPPHLFWNCRAAGRHRVLSCHRKGRRAPICSSRSSAAGRFADIDGDGDLDVVLTATGQPPLLLRNDQQLGHHWLRLKLTGTKSNRDAIGAWVAVELEGRTLRQQVMPSRSYLSQVELPVTFGLGPDDKVRGVTVHWPCGGKQEIEITAIDRVIDVTER